MTPGVVVVVVGGAVVGVVVVGVLVFAGGCEADVNVCLLRWKSVKE